MQGCRSQCQCQSQSPVLTPVLIPVLMPRIIPWHCLDWSDSLICKHDFFLLHVDAKTAYHELSCNANDVAVVFSRHDWATDQWLTFCQSLWLGRHWRSSSLCRRTANALLWNKCKDRAQRWTRISLSGQSKAFVLHLMNTVHRHEPPTN